MSSHIANGVISRMNCELEPLFFLEFLSCGVISCVRKFVSDFDFSIFYFSRRCSDSVNPNVIKTLKRSVILARSGGPKRSGKQPARN